MKVLTVALIAFLGLTDATKPITGRELKKRMDNGHFNKRTLMRGSRAYNEATQRKLEDGSFELSASHNIQFNTCLSLSVQDEDLFDDEYIEAAASGNLVAAKSFILFDVCYSESCNNAEDKMTFITDLASYFESMIQYTPSQIESYCEVCQDNKNYCYQQWHKNQGAYGTGSDQGSNWANNNYFNYNMQQQQQQTYGNGTRFLAQNNTQYIECDTCFEYQCYVEDNDEDEAEQKSMYGYYDPSSASTGEKVYNSDGELVTMADSLEWLTEIAECSQMLEEVEDVEVFAGLICNEEGDGIEIGVFADEECTLFYRNIPVQRILDDDSLQMAQMTVKPVQSIFLDGFSCTDVTYMTPYEQNGEQQQYNENDDAGAFEACSMLFESDFGAVNTYDCDVEDDDYNDNDGDSNDEEYDQNLNYQWYNYDITQDQMEDAQEICLTVKNLNETYTTLFTSGDNPGLYSYDRSDWEGIGWKTKSGSSWIQRNSGVIAGLALAAIALGVISGFVMARASKNQDDKKEALISSGDGWKKVSIALEPDVKDMSRSRTIV